MSKAPAGKKGGGHDDHGHHGAHGGGHGGGGHDDHGGGGHCPPPWIITFADMATLLMAFFVIMLMTAKSDQPKFNAFAAVMRQTFGTVPDGGDSVLQLNFGPQSGEQTDEPPGTTPQSGDPNTPQSGDEEGTGKKGSGSGDAAKEAAEALGKAMRDAVSKGQIKVESDQGEVIVRLPPGAGAKEAEQIAQSLRQAAEAAAAEGAGAGQGAGQSGAGGQNGQPGDAPTGGKDAAPQSEGRDAGQGAGAAQQGADAGAGAAGGASAAGAQSGAAGQQAGDAAGGAGAQSNAGAQGGAGAAGLGGETPASSGGAGAIKAEIAAIQLGMVLDDQLSSGDVRVERKDGEVVLTVGSGGAFQSGSSDMTAQAQDIISKLEQVSQSAKRIVVTGHTDNVPVSGGEFRDNWDLASARAQSVVRAIEESGVLPNAELQAVSKGDTEPIADNETAEGRAKNRRIEIKIEFEE